MESNASFQFMHRIGLHVGLLVGVLGECAVVGRGVCISNVLNLAWKTK